MSGGDAPRHSRSSSSAKVFPGPQVWVVALVALMLGSVLIIRNLVAVDGDVTIFTAFGAEAEQTLEYGERLLGEVYVRELQGHDGKFFFVQANDPLLLTPSEHAVYLDRPLYRAQRMLYPLLASGFGVLSPGAVVWSMVVVNLLALALGTVATAMVARGMGGSSWWGLAFGLNPGLLNEVLLSGAGVLGAAIAMAAVAALQRGRVGWAVGAMVAAILAREVMLVTAVGMAWWMWNHDLRRRARWMIAAPLVAALLWAAYLRFRLGWQDGATQVEELGLPLVGFVRSFDMWGERPLGMAVGITVMVLLVTFTLRLLKGDHLVGWAAAGFVPLTTMLTSQVWLNDFDITRAVAPLITAFLLMAFAARRTTPSGSSM